MSAGRLEVEIAANGTKFRQEMRRVEGEAKASAGRMSRMLQGISAAQIFGMVGQVEGFATAIAKMGESLFDVADAFNAARQGSENWYSIVREMPMGINQLISLGERLSDTMRGDNLYGGQREAEEAFRQMQLIGEQSARFTDALEAQQQARRRLAEASEDERDNVRDQIALEERLAKIQQARAQGLLSQSAADRYAQEERALFALERRREAEDEAEAEAERARRRESASMAGKEMTERMRGEGLALGFSTANIGGGGFGQRKQEVGDPETHDLLREMLQKLGTVPQGLTI